MNVSTRFVICALFASGQLLAATSNLDLGDSLYAAGKFVEAERVYASAIADNPQSVPAHLRLGQIALYSNQLEDAEKHLKKAAELSPDDAKPKNLLGEVYYRKDSFTEAARWYRAAGDESRAAALESFKNTAPCRIEGRGDTTTLKFVAIEPLPVVQVRVNGGDPVDFLIDTGGPEVLLSADYAKQLGVEVLAAGTGTFAGGKQAAVQRSRIASLALGDWMVHDLPVKVVPLPELGDHKIHGVLGTVLFYHFQTTLDYPKEQLILRRKASATSLRLAKNQFAIPFWMAGDHFMVAWGRVNQAPPALLFVDTGFAGGGFLCPESTLKEAGIPLPKEQAAGPVPFVVDILSLGEARGEKINGLTGVFPPTLENQFGFRIAGLVSHQFLKPFAITFDFAGMKLVLEKP